MRLEERVIHCPDLGAITAYVDSETTTIVVEVDNIYAEVILGGPSELAAYYTQLTDEDIIVIAQIALDEHCGKGDRVLH